MKFEVEFKDEFEIECDDRIRNDEWKIEELVATVRIIIRIEYLISNKVFENEWY
jgi:hypothetical protein